MKNALKFLIILTTILFLITLILYPEPAKEGTIKGLLVCGRIIIPSLFAFCAVLGFILNCDFIKKLKIRKETLIFILSLFGGYPMGAKMLSISAENGSISKENAEKTLNFSINCGPSFAISVVGLGLLNSKPLGLALYFSNCLASFIIFLIIKSKFKPTNTKQIKKTDNENIIDNFVNSCVDAANTCTRVSIFIIFFSVINSYISIFSGQIKFFKILIFLNEITYATAHTKNIYLISFLLSFSGFCIWLQIFSIAKGFKINYIKFAFFRIFHGILSAIITKVLISIFKISISTISNIVPPVFTLGEKTTAFSLSLVLCAIVFIISLYSKLYVCKFSEDMV